jgi:hypothetical protein
MLKVHAVKYELKPYNTLIFVPMNKIYYYQFNKQV